MSDEPAEARRDQFLKAFHHPKVVNLGGEAQTVTGERQDQKCSEERRRGFNVQCGRWWERTVRILVREIL